MAEKPKLLPEVDTAKLREGLAFLMARRHFWSESEREIMDAVYKAVIVILNRRSPLPEGGASGWRTIDSAPKDGTEAIKAVLAATRSGRPLTWQERRLILDALSVSGEALRPLGASGSVGTRGLTSAPLPPVPEQEGASHTEEQGRSAAKPNERTPSETR